MKSRGKDEFFRRKRPELLSWQRKGGVVYLLKSVGKI